MSKPWKPARSPYWHYDFQIDGQRYHGSTHCTGRRAAEAVIARLRHQAALPSLARPAITLDEAAGLYHEHAERLPSWPTIRYLTAALIKGLGANRLLSGIAQRELQVYFARRRSGRSNASINREIENARAIWRRAMRTRYDVGEMPDWGALRLKVAEQPPRELDADTEEAALFAALAADVHDCFRFLLGSGWRRGEVLGLRWSDLDLPNREASTRIKGGNIVRRPLTTRLIALIANQPRVTPFVFTYLCRQNRARRRKGQRYPLTASVLRDRWTEALAAANIAPLRIHDLRHTLGTRIVRATGNLAAAREALKHRHIRTTLRYAHVLAEDVRTALDAAAESRNSPELPNQKSRKA
jgi:integrase